MEFLIPPLIGGVIGYITNDIAIKMLFRPRTAKYLGKWKLPFTPGLIPKEKERIAESIGNVISTRLLDSQTLSEVLLSADTLHKLKNAMTEFVKKNEENTDTLWYALSKYIPTENLHHMYRTARGDISDFAYEKISSSDFGTKITSDILYWVRDAVFFIRIPILDKLGGEKLAQNIINPIAETIGREVNKAILEHTGEVIEQTIDKEAKKLFNARVCDLISSHYDKIEEAIEFIMRMYIKVITDNLPDIIKGLDISGIVKNKINSFDNAELEDIIMSIMKKELRAIVWLGAGLGFIMGWLNLLVKFV